MSQEYKVIKVIKVILEHKDGKKVEANVRISDDEDHSQYIITITEDKVDFINTTIKLPKSGPKTSDYWTILSKKVCISPQYKAIEINNHPLPHKLYYHKTPRNIDNNLQISALFLNSFCSNTLLVNLIEIGKNGESVIQILTKISGVFSLLAGITGFFRSLNAINKARKAKEDFERYIQHLEDDDAEKREYNKFKIKYFKLKVKQEQIDIYRHEIRILLDIALFVVGIISIISGGPYTLVIGVVLITLLRLTTQVTMALKRRYAAQEVGFTEDMKKMASGEQQQAEAKFLSQQANEYKDLRKRKFWWYVLEFLSSCIITVFSIMTGISFISQSLNIPQIFTLSGNEISSIDLVGALAVITAAIGKLLFIIRNLSQGKKMENAVKPLPNEMREKIRKLSESSEAKSETPPQANPVAREDGDSKLQRTLKPLEDIGKQPEATSETLPQAAHVKKEDGNSEHQMTSESSKNIGKQPEATSETLPQAAHVTIREDGNSEEPQRTLEPPKGTGEQPEAKSKAPLPADHANTISKDSNIELLSTSDPQQSPEENTKQLLEAIAKVLMVHDELNPICQEAGQKDGDSKNECFKLNLDGIKLGDCFSNKSNSADKTNSCLNICSIFTSRQKESAFPGNQITAQRSFASPP